MSVRRTRPKVSWLCLAVLGLPVPSLAAELASLSAHEEDLSRPPEGWSDVALATVLLAPVYDRLERPRYVVGSIQRGTTVAARPADSTEVCHDRDQAGRWYEIPGGFICTASGYKVNGSSSALSPPQRRPDLSKAVPFDFVKVKSAASIRYEAPRAVKEAIEEYQTPAYFLAVDRELDVDGTKWVRTVYDEFVQAKELDPVVPTRLVGERLGDGRRLPLAFVYGAEEGVPVECWQQGQFRPCGQAPKHSRFAVQEAPSAGRLKRPDDRFVRTEHLRIVRRIDRPEGIPDGAKWVHIDLAQQAFVAYEGDRPVYTSLISTGAQGYETPNGLHRVYRKYVTKTMRGPDADAGRYRVEEIPWVMYYDGNYALHGAYWHNQFGEVRSHGCTNIAPTDAKWLYRWGTGHMPPGWHANYRVKDGTWVYLTGSRRPS